MVAVAVVVVIAIAIVLFTAFLLRLERKRLRYAHIPGPKSYPIVGNALQLKRTSADFTQQLYEMSEEFARYGVFRFQLGSFTYIAVCRSEHAEVVSCYKKNARFSKAFTKQMFEFFSEFGGHGLFRMQLCNWTYIAVTRSHYAEGQIQKTNCQAEEGFTKQLYEYFETYGKREGILRLFLFDHPLVLVCSAKLSESVFNSTKHMDKSSDYDFLHPWLRTGLLTSTGDKWRYRRKLLTPTFHFRILNDFVGVFNDQAQIMIDKLKLKADGRVFDIFSDITLCALDIICETAMGRNVGAQKNADSEYVQAVYTITERIIQRQRSPWFWPDILYYTIGYGKEHDRCLRILHGFTEKVIGERSGEFFKQQKASVTMDDILKQKEEEEAQGIVGKKKRLAFLDMLLCASEDGQKLDHLDIREEVDTFMFEGHDTTAAAINWAVHLIGCDPAIQEKVHQELDTIFGDSDRCCTMEDLKEMKYLECCVKEALRIFPSVPFFGRSLTEDCKIGGYDLQKGMSLIVVPAAIHRDEKYFPDPEIYNPDRFLPENSVQRHPFAYIPFSAGFRNCIGQKFALLEEKVLLSSIFRNFHIKSCQTREELVPVAELIMRSENGILVQLTPRKRISNGI